jgi:Zn-dependent protease
MAGIELIILIIIFLFSVVIHEVAHGWVAYSLGDPTAKYAGRLTLNPIKHLDPIGSILVPGFLILMTVLGAGGIIFGWAKPVPINPYNFRDQKYGEAKVALAGPLSNFILALTFGLALRFFPVLWGIPGISAVFLFIVQINLILAIFNLMPVPPLDGSHIFFTFLGERGREMKIALSQYGFLLLIFILFFFFQYIVLAVTWLTGLIIGFPV